MEEFLSGLVAIVVTLSDEEEMVVMDAFINMSSKMLLDREVGSYSSEIIKKHKELASQLTKESKLADALEMLKQFSNFVSNFLGRVFGMAFPEVTFSSFVWPQSFAPWIWCWIHPFTRYLDQRCGDDVKRNFVLLLLSVIKCMTCHEHYKQSIDGILDGMKKAPLQNVFLALHTHTKISNDQVRNRFAYSAALIEEKYLITYDVFQPRLFIQTL